MENRTKILLLFIAGIAINLWSIYTWDTSYVANDGIQYLSTAKNWLAGNGFSTDVLMYTPHFQGSLPAAQTVWPPGYPFAIALIYKLGIDLEIAALALNLLTHALASLVMWLVLTRMGLDRFFAAICAFAFYFMAMPWAYVSALMTEPVVTTLMLCALLFLPDPHNSRIHTWLLCGLAIALCIYIRYSGVFLAAGTGAGILFYLLFYERRTWRELINPCYKLSILLLLPALAFGHLMYRTNTLIGTFDRYSGSKNPETITSTVKRWGLETSELLGFTSESHLSDIMSIVLFILLVLLVSAIATWFLASRISSSENGVPTKELQYFRIAGLCAVFHGLALASYLSIASISSSPLEIVSRYIYQLYPGLYAVFCFMLHALIKRHRSGAQYGLVTGLTTLLAAIYILAQVNASKVTRTNYFAQSKSDSKMMHLQVTERSTLAALITSCFSNNTDIKSIWSTHGQPIHLHTGLPTLTHSDIYTKQPFNAEHLAARIDQYNVGMFVFVHQSGMSDQQYNHYMDSVKAWIAKQGFVNIPMLSNKFGDNKSVEIYTIEDCSS